MTTFLLVRHAAHDWLGRGFAGRLPGVSLNAEGQRQAAALVDRLAAFPLDAIHSSPQQRTRETAEPIAAARGLPVRVEPGVDEIDFGAWTGRTFDEVRGDPAWTPWVERRGSARPPGGERFADVPRRAMEALQRLAQGHPQGHVLVVSHADVLKAVVAQVLGFPLDRLEQFDIAPASLTLLELGAGWQKLRLLNAPAS
ncbi:MAG TPA: histidine phosphatase family protein [Ramlibacter sp.]|nr:histidine phosphatase family protein [Ramlibacter sp.]